MTESKANDFNTVRDFNLAGKRVIVRADLNVPRNDALEVTDTTRIDRVKKTIDYLRSQNASVLVLSHFGRPDGETNSGMSLASLLPAIEKSWGVPVSFSRDCVGDAAEKFSRDLKPGSVALLENVRFHKGEKTNDPAFAAELAKNGDIYVNDAFSTAHRAHASTEGIAHILPAAAGLLMEEELNALNQALESPVTPVAAIVGGSKISTKLDVLNNLIEKVDFLILGGAMANTFVAANGGDVGDSMCEYDMADQAREILARAESKGCQIILPIDAIAIKEFRANADNISVDADAIPEGYSAVDIGEKSRANVIDILDGCKTILWNGPMGVFELKPLDAGTNAIAQAVAKGTQEGRYISVAGGGDTVAALANAGVADDFTYISSAGGAFLESIEGKDLPGVAALKRKAGDNLPTLDR